MTNVGNNDSPGAQEDGSDRVARLEHQIDELRSSLAELRTETASEVRTHRVVVVDEHDRPVIDLSPYGDGGRLTLGTDYGKVLITAGSMSPARIDLVSGIVPCEMGVHLCADFDTHSSLLALSGHGDVLGEYHLLGDDRRGWRLEYINDVHN